MRKPRKTVEIVLRVSVPGHWSAAHARNEVTNSWYGEVYAGGPDRQDVTLRPRWGKARVVKKPADDGGYLDRFPPEHRASADRAYQDGFADGVKDAGGADE